MHKKYTRKCHMTPKSVSVLDKRHFIVYYVDNTLKGAMKGAKNMNIFEAVKERVPIVDAALYLGLHGKRTSPNRGTFCCPFHGDSHPSLVCYDKPDKHDFYCFSCNKWGNVIDLAVQVLGLQPIAAAKRLAEHWNVAYDDDRGTYVRSGFQDQPQEGKLLADFLFIWRRYHQQIWLDRAEVWKKRRLAYEDAQQEETPGWVEALERGSKARLEAARWGNMCLADILEEVKHELSQFDAEEHPIRTIEPARLLRCLGSCT